jgi:hypothetical protein
MSSESSTASGSIERTVTLVARVRDGMATVVRVLGQLGVVVAGTRSSSLAALGGLGQLAAALVFVVNMCTRVRMPGGGAPPA